MTTPAFKIGVQLPEVERRVEWPELFAMAHTAEEAGFDSIWLGDHLLYDLPDGSTRGPWEVWTSLAALATATSHVQIGPLVASTSFHDPPMLAKMAATVDAISGGRLIVGLGAGWNRREYSAFGLPYDHRVSRFEEAFTIIRTLLRDGRTSFAGRYYEIDDCVLDPPPARPGGPPLMLGSTSPRMLSIGLPHVDAWNVWWSIYGNTPTGFTAIKETIDVACRECGRDPAAIDATAAVYVQLGGSGRLMGDDYRGEEVQPLRGDASELAGQLAAFARAGVSHAQLVVDPITQQSIETLGDAIALVRRLL